MYITVRTKIQLNWLNLPHLPILPPPVTAKNNEWSYKLIRFTAMPVLVNISARKRSAVSVTRNGQFESNEALQ